MSVLNGIGSLGRGIVGEMVEHVYGRPIDRPLVTNEERLRYLFIKINACYKNYEGSSLGPSDLNALLATSITLADLRAAEGYPIREEIVETLQLKGVIQSIDRRFFPFFERLKTVSYKVLEEVSLFWLQLNETERNFQRSPVYHALMSDEEFISIEQREVANRKDLRIFATRLNEIFETKISLVLYLSRLPPIRQEEGLRFCTAARLRVLSSQYLHKCAADIVDEAWGFLDENQLKTLDFRYLSPNQVERCIRGAIDDEETIQRRFLALLPRQLPLVLSTLSGRSLLKMVPLDLFTNLSLADLTEDLISELFSSMQNQKELAQARVFKVSIDEINRALPRLHFDFIRLLSHEQIGGLDFSQMNLEQLERGFCALCQMYDERVERVRSIPVHAVPTILQKGARVFMSYFSEEQKRGAQIREEGAL